MSKLDDLKVIICHLNNHEIEKVQHYINQFPKPNIEEAHLFQYLVSNQNEEIEQMEEQNSFNKFSVLVSTLYDRVLDALSLNLYHEFPESYSEIGKARLTVRKNLLFIQYLITKSHFKESIPFYDKTIALAKKFELYDELLLALYELQNLYSALVLVDEYEANSRETEKYEKIRALVRAAFQLFNRQLFETTMYPNDVDRVNRLEQNLVLLKKYFDESQSPQAGWFYYRVLVEYQQATGDYHGGRKTCEALLKLQETGWAIGTDSFLAMSYKLLTRFNILDYQFDEALVSIKKAQLMDTSAKHNRNLNLETEFYIYFHKTDYKEAASTLKKLYPPDQAFNQSKHAYYRACCSFFNAPKNVGTHLSQTKDVEKDKEGWNIHVRLLQIMHLCEGKKWDVAQAHIESLRKHLERTRKSGNIHPRFMAIFKALRELANCGFDFGKAWKKQPELFARLASDTDPELRWHMLSPELIRFDTWFEAKTRHLTYTEVFAERVKARQAQNPPQT